MNHFWFLVLSVLVLLQVCVAPPVDPKKPSEDEHSQNEVSPNNENEDLGLEYNRYLKEVVQALESDPEFRKKLESADQEDIRNGKIARELDYVHHNVRSKLDELKRQEMERLRHLAMQEYERSQGIPAQNRLKLPGHIDHKNPMTFEIEDLRKLIVQTTRDLEAADRQRKEEFKQYEMQKEFEHNEKLKVLDEEKRKAEQKAWEESQNKHKQHPKLHHPGSKDQLEEVWEKQDHLDPESFDPRTFFALHDLDGNQVWDADEVKALFTKELDKMYDPNAPEDDMKERYEEMERMREHVFNESDVNRDGLISYQEFLDQTKKAEFERDPGWQGLDEQPVYNREEYVEFERQRQEEIQRLIQQGLISPQEAAQYMQQHQQHVPVGPHYMPPAQHPNQQGQFQQGMEKHQQYQQQHQQQQQYQQPEAAKQNALPGHCKVLKMERVHLIPSDDEDIYSGFNEYNPITSTTDLESDVGFQTALKSSHEHSASTRYCVSLRNFWRTLLSFFSPAWADEICLLYPAQTRFREVDLFGHSMPGGI
nr:EOG090X0B17 [Triops cancriformis]